MSDSKAGYVALLGRPNVGKSTLLNRLLREKISITSAKPQTTRQAVLGISTLDNVQIVYVDTPGLHTNAKRAINRYMNREARAALGYVDVAVLLVAALRWTEEDQHAVEQLQDFTGPVILAINKIDKLKDPAELLPFIDKLQQHREFAEIVPLSALKQHNLDTLQRLIIERLPNSEFLYDAEQITTVSERFLVAELIREKLIRALHDELPYALTVEIEKFEQTSKLLRVLALIWVERPGQKAIVIGNGGETLKQIGRQVRAELQQRFGTKVYLQTWVKVRAGWSDDERALQSFGYRSDS